MAASESVSADQIWRTGRSQVCQHPALSKVRRRHQELLIVNTHCVSGTALQTLHTRALSLGPRNNPEG